MVRPNLYSVSLAGIDDDVWPPVSKNFAAWRELLARSGPARWYARCDDDAFVNADVLLKGLEMAVPDPLHTAVVAGAAATGDRRERLNLTFVYPQGGSCEVISAAAAAKLSPRLAACQARAEASTAKLVHSDVEFGRCVHEASIRFAQGLGDNLFNMMGQAVMYGRVENISRGERYSIGFERLEHALRFEGLVTPSLQPTFGVIHPIKSEEVMLYLLDLFHSGLTPIGSKRLKASPCAHSPQALAYYTACCNARIYVREVALAARPYCLADHCSKLRPECPLPSRHAPHGGNGAAAGGGGAAAVSAGAVTAGHHGGGDATLHNPHAVIATLDVTSERTAALAAEAQRATMIAFHPLQAVRGSQVIRGDGIENLTPGEVGLRLTFQAAVRDAIARNASALVWLEEDAMLDDEFPRRFAKLLTSERCWGYLASPGGVLQLGANEWTPGAFGLDWPVKIPKSYEQWRQLTEDNDLWMPTSVDAQLLEQANATGGGGNGTGFAALGTDTDGGARGGGTGTTTGTGGNTTSSSARAAAFADTAMCYNSLPHTLGTVGMVLSRHVLPLVREWLGASNRPIDHVLEYIKVRGYPVRTAYPNLVIPSMHESTVDPKAAGFRKHGEMAWGEILLAHRWNVSSYHEPRLREEM